MVTSLTQIKMHFMESLAVSHVTLDIPVTYKFLACEEVKSNSHHTMCLEVYSAASTHAVHLVLSVNLAFNITYIVCFDS